MPVSVTSRSDPLPAKSFGLSVCGGNLQYQQLFTSTHHYILRLSYCLISTKIKMSAVIEKLREYCRERGAHGIIGLSRAFRLIDDNRDRKLDLEEMKIGLREYGATLDDDEISELFQEIDKDGSGTVSFDEFLKAVRPPLSPRSPGHHRESLRQNGPQRRRVRHARRLEGRLQRQGTSGCHSGKEERRRGAAGIPRQFRHAQQGRWQGF
ncbi:calcyphosin-like protein [Caerostris darwini]|uniref:Calcyphosin-like protein n=1 Tax=Caerostris darwini TaxID=1538125 RepID=A0AAV4N8V0_9ARAC|nr:calcyphosin-like protein [Caerostris darwini]